MGEKEDEAVSCERRVCVDSTGAVWIVQLSSKSIGGAKGEWSRSLVCRGSFEAHHCDVAIGFCRYNDQHSTTTTGRHSMMK